MLHHLIDMAIARLLQLRAQPVARQLLPFMHHQRMAVQEIVRAVALHQRIDRQDQHAARQRWQAIERGKAGRDDVLMWREAVERQRFPVGQADHRLAGKLLDLILQPQRGLHIRRNQHYQPPVTLRHLRAFDGAGGAGELSQLALIGCRGGQGIANLFRHSRFDVLSVYFRGVIIPQNAARIIC